LSPRALAEKFPGGRGSQRKRRPKNNKRRPKNSKKDRKIALLSLFQERETERKTEIAKIAKKTEK